MPKNQSHKKEDPEFFDDCPICQATKEGKTSVEDLKEAFCKAKEQGAVVGDDLIDDEDEG